MTDARPSIAPPTVSYLLRSSKQKRLGVRIIFRPGAHSTALLSDLLRSVGTIVSSLSRNPNLEKKKETRKRKERRKKRSGFSWSLTEGFSPSNQMGEDKGNKGQREGCWKPMSWQRSIRRSFWLLGTTSAKLGCQTLVTEPMRHVGKMRKYENAKRPFEPFVTHDAGAVKRKVSLWVHTRPTCLRSAGILSCSWSRIPPVIARLL